MIEQLWGYGAQTKAAGRHNAGDDQALRVLEQALEQIGKGKVKQIAP